MFDTETWGSPANWIISVLNLAFWLLAQKFVSAEIKEWRKEEQARIQAYKEEVDRRFETSEARRDKDLAEFKEQWANARLEDKTTETELRHGAVTKLDGSIAAVRIPQMRQEERITAGSNKAHELEIRIVRLEESRRSASHSSD